MRQRRDVGLVPFPEADQHAALFGNIPNAEARLAPVPRDRPGDRLHDRLRNHLSDPFEILRFGFDLESLGGFSIPSTVADMTVTMGLPKRGFLSPRMNEAR